MNEPQFFQIVTARNTNKDGTVKDPNLMRRLRNPICRACQDRYRQKFPDQPFQIYCDGVPDEPDFQEMSQKTGLSYEQTRDIMDKQYWAERHTYLTDDRGDVKPFKARDYQIPMLRCTARRKVDRCGRGLGKTTLGVIEELHSATTHKNYPIMVAAPAKSQAQKWFDDILWQAEQSPEIAKSIIQKQQQPFYKIRFSNGSTISIFTCGSASGRGADVIRSQTPRRVRLEEQDGLNEEDYKALQPLFRRYKNSEFHGASTPKGDHSTFWAMCTQYPDYKEFHVPITEHPEWGPEMEEACRREARTNINYVHEFLADFGNPEEGVFKAAFVDWARKPYRYEECRYDAQCKYVMGVDWNGEGTGTRIRVVEYNPLTALRRAVAFETIDGDEVATLDFLNSIRNLNRVWHCDRVYVDAGFGYIQDSLIRDLGRVAEIPEDRKLEYVRVVDFGATLKTNKLIPRRGKFKYLRQDDLDRRTKPFMVEGAVAVLEQHLFEFSDKDTTLDSQMRAYRVKTWSAHGHANTYEAGREGDHDLDATLLALLGIELEFGLFAQAPLPPATVRHIPTVHQSDVPVRSRAETVPSRQMVSSQQRRRVAFVSRNSWIEIPGRASPSGPRTEIPSRTARIQRPGSRGPMGRKG